MPAPTMKDIATDLGVSIVTVSKVLRNHSDISDGTRKRVMKRVKELNYQPNWVARSLVTRSTQMVGLVVPDLGSHFFAEVAKGIGRKIQAKGFHLITSSSGEDPARERQEIDWLVSRRVDALAVCSVHDAGSAEEFHHLEEKKVPYILVDRHLPGLKVTYVGGDDEAIGRMATKHLIDCGRTRIAHIRGPEFANAQARERGYRRTLSRNKLEVRDDYIVSGELSESSGSGYLAAQSLLKLKPRPDGIVCFNDSVAVGALKAILEARLKVPGDIAVIGAGNDQHSDVFLVPLTTIDQNSLEIGVNAGAQILRLLKAKRTPPTKTIHIEPKLIVRESTKKPGRGKS